jgi:hypothetical protein
MTRRLWIIGMSAITLMAAAEPSRALDTGANACSAKRLCYAVGSRCKTGWECCSQVCDCKDVKVGCRCT